MRILLLSKYGYLGASSRMRSYQYIPSILRENIDITLAPLLNDDYIKNLYLRRGKKKYSILKFYLNRVVNLLQSRSYDLLWIEKELLPWTPAVVEELLHIFKIPYIVDYDDAVFHCYDEHPNPIIRLILGKKIDKVMNCATVVTAGNEYLAARAIKAGAKRVEIIPTVVDLEKYLFVPTPYNTVFTIGWIGSPTTSKYLTIIQSVLQEFTKTYNARVILIGSGLVNMGDVPVETRQWIEANEVKDIQEFDVGIMPLPDEPFERGKCGYKLIQYMALGRPVVASPVGVNKTIVEHGVNGFLANTKQEWLNALSMLYKDVELRKEMGRAGRRKVEKQYCLQITAPQLSSLLRESVVKKPK